MTIYERQVCTLCKVLKPINAYYTHHRNRYWCKQCTAKQATLYRNKVNTEAIEKLNTQIQGLSVEEAMHYLWPKYRLGEIKRSHLDVVLDQIIKVQ